MKFFRRIRYNLLKKSKPASSVGRTGKYLKYAIGEIILVVIGILIALQINNWNEESAIHNKQLNYLKSIRNEMANNLLSLEKEEIKISKKTINQLELFRILNSSEAIDTISEKGTAQLYYNSFNTPLATSIESGALQEIITSGGLKDIKNDSIRKLLASWEAKLLPLKMQEKDMKDTLEGLIYLLVNKKLLNMRYYLSLLYTDDELLIEKPIKVHSLKNMLRSEEFENLCITYYGKSQYLLKSVYPEYKANLMSIIGLIDADLKK